MPKPREAVDEPWQEAGEEEQEGPARRKPGRKFAGGALVFIGLGLLGSLIALLILLAESLFRGSKNG